MNLWIRVEDQLPPRHQNVWCYNRNGRQFEGRICAGMHKPFFTYPWGDGSASNTAPSWIDVTHWKPLDASPGNEMVEVKALAKYQEHHYPGQHDVGVAWTGNRLWVCLDGASLFRAKLMDGKLFVSFTPPEKQR